MSDTPRTDAEAFYPHDSARKVCDADFARQLERELNAAIAHFRRLEEAGDAIVGNNIGCGCGEDGPCRACRNAVEAWRNAKEAKP